MVISQGHQVYFGPASEARDYFVSLGYKNLPRQSTADYLTGCTGTSQCYNPSPDTFCDVEIIELVQIQTSVNSLKAGTPPTFPRHQSNLRKPTALRLNMQ